MAKTEASKQGEALTRLSTLTAQRERELTAAETADRRISGLIAYGRGLTEPPTMEQMGEAIGLTRDGVYRRLRRGQAPLAPGDRSAIDFGHIHGATELLARLHELWQEREAAESRARGILADMQEALRQAKAEGAKKYQLQRIVGTGRAYRSVAKGESRDGAKA